MLDGVKNTHCAAPRKKNKRKREKKKGLVHANRHNHSYILAHKLFTGSFETVYSDTHALPSTHRDSWEIQWKWFWWDASTRDKSQRQQEGKKNSLKESHGCTLYGTEAKGKLAGLPLKEMRWFWRQAVIRAGCRCRSRRSLILWSMFLEEKKKKSRKDE